MYANSNSIWGFFPFYEDTSLASLESLLGVDDDDDSMIGIPRSIILWYII
jgi:hypothetical protein